MADGGLPRRTRRRVGRVVRRERARPALALAVVHDKARSRLAGLGDPLSTLDVVFGGNCVAILGTELVLRVSRQWPIEPGTERLAWEAARSAGCPAPEHVGSGHINGHPFVVYRRIGGHPPSGVQDIRAAAVALARLHTADAGTFPAELRSRYRRRERFAIALDAVAILPRADRHPVRRLIEDARDDWAIRRPVAVHGDFRRSNLLAANGRITGVLDWSDCRRGSRESDLGGAEVRDVCGLVAAYEEIAAQPVDRRIVAGYVLARCLALRAFGVPGVASDLGPALRLITTDGWESP